ncbi:MAG: hypothetical protein QOD03_931 [Verrucomicrobiota bacterium]
MNSIALTTTESADATVTLNARLAPAYSGSINDVVKLAKSGVDESVVLAYIKTSSGPYQPNANEIVKLHNEGISSPVITAILERGGELRQQYQSTQAASPASYSQPAPAVVEQPQYAQPVYSAPVSTVAYIGGGYPSYSYPAYYGYGYSSYYPYSYSSYCYPRYYSSCYPRIGFYGGFGPRFSVGGRIGDFRFGGNFHGGFASAHFGGNFGGGNFHGGFGGGHSGGGHSGGGMHHR